MLVLPPSPALLAPKACRPVRHAGPPRRFAMVEPDDEQTRETSDEEEGEEEEPSSDGAASGGASRKRPRGCGHKHNNRHKKTGKKTRLCDSCLCMRFFSNYTVAPACPS